MATREQQLVEAYRNGRSYTLGQEIEAAKLFIGILQKNPSPANGLIEFLQNYEVGDRSIMRVMDKVVPDLYAIANGLLQVIMIDCEKELGIINEGGLDWMALANQLILDQAVRTEQPAQIATDAIWSVSPEQAEADCIARIPQWNELLETFKSSVIYTWVLRREDLEGEPVHSTGGGLAELALTLTSESRGMQLALWKSIANQSNPTGFSFTLAPKSIPTAQ